MTLNAITYYIIRKDIPVSRTQPTRTQTSNKYDVYLASNGNPQDVTSNPLNLFDANNIEDKAWFWLAQTYLAHKKEGPNDQTI